MNILNDLVNRQRQCAADVDALLKKDKAKLERQRRKLVKLSQAAKSLEEKLDYQRQVRETDNHLRQWHLSYYENFDRLESEMFS
jgi:flagellar biosynthesis/type III secretory pathway chaperone